MAWRLQLAVIGNAQRCELWLAVTAVQSMPIDTCLSFPADWT